MGQIEMEEKNIHLNSYASKTAWCLIVTEETDWVDLSVSWSQSRLVHGILFKIALHLI